jgi:DNA-3-methyladenine glycosylase II
MQTTGYFEYGDKEIAHLKAKDSALAKLMDEVGVLRRPVMPDMFVALLNKIIGQQISAKARATVWARMQNMFAPLTPEYIASIPLETLRSCGISTKKTEYIKEMAESVLNGNLDLEQLRLLDDDAVCRRLSEIKGIGVWTAEMLMISSMNRMNILSWGDLAIHRGLRMLYRHRKITPTLFTKYKKRYFPYASVASLYLWALAGENYEGYKDPAAKSCTAKAKINVAKQIEFNEKSNKAPTVAI